MINFWVVRMPHRIVELSNCKAFYPMSGLLSLPHHICDQRGCNDYCCLLHDRLHAMIAVHNIQMFARNRFLPLYIVAWKIKIQSHVLWQNCSFEFEIQNVLYCNKLLFVT